MKKATKKNKSKKIVTWAMVIILALTAIVLLKVFYDWSFKQGYLEGTNNQVLCQAAQKDNTLTKLCK